MFFRANRPVYRFVARRTGTRRTHCPAIIRGFVEDRSNSALLRACGRGGHDVEGYLQRLAASEGLRRDTEAGRDSVVSGYCFLRRLAILHNRPRRGVCGQPGGRSGKELGCPTAAGNSITKEDWAGTQGAWHGQHRCHSQDGFHNFVPPHSAHSHLDLQYSEHSPSCTRRTISGRSGQRHPAIIQAKGLVGKLWQPRQAVGAPRGRRGGGRQCIFSRGKCRFCSVAIKPHGPLRSWNRSSRVRSVLVLYRRWRHGGGESHP
jgi:hypothetical protein